MPGCSPSDGIQTAIRLSVLYMSGRGSWYVGQSGRRDHQPRRNQAERPPEALLCAPPGGQASKCRDSRRQWAFLSDWRGLSSVEGRSHVHPRATEIEGDILNRGHARKATASDGVNLTKAELALTGSNLITLRILATTRSPRGRRCGGAALTSVTIGEH